jgi:RNA recognition motif-containing protein
MKCVKSKPYTSKVFYILFDENYLKQISYRFGDIKSTKAIIEKQTNKCKGYGFVDYKNPEDARTALIEMKKEQKDVQLAKQREQDPTNLYFANLPADITEERLTEMLINKFTAKVNSARFSFYIFLILLLIRSTCNRQITK